MYRAYKTGRSRGSVGTEAGDGCKDGSRASDTCHDVIENRCSTGDVKIEGPVSNEKACQVGADAVTKKDPCSENKELLEKTSGYIPFVPAEDLHVDPEVNEIVEDCWKTVEDQCIQEREDRERKAMEKQSKPSDSKGWKTIRVFVSSTFTDMHSEREILVKKVFN